MVFATPYLNDLRTRPAENAELAPLPVCDLFGGLLETSSVPAWVSKVVNVIFFTMLLIYLLYRKMLKFILWVTTWPSMLLNWSFELLEARLNRLTASGHVFQITAAVLGTLLTANNVYGLIFRFTVAFPILLSRDTNIPTEVHFPVA